MRARQRLPISFPISGTSMIVGPPWQKHVVARASTWFVLGFEVWVSEGKHCAQRCPCAYAPDAATEIASKMLAKRSIDMIEIFWCDEMLCRLLIYEHNMRVRSSGTPSKHVEISRYFMSLFSGGRARQSAELCLCLCGVWYCTQFMPIPSLFFSKAKSASAKAVSC